MKYAVIVVRLLLGLAFVVFGLNGFLHFLPMPPQPKGPASDFTGALMGSGYFYPIAALQVAGGAILLIGRYIPLGLTLLGPVVVNILLFHTFLDRSGLPIALIFSALTLFLLWAHRERFAPLVKP